MKEISFKKVNETLYYDKCENGLDIYMWVIEHANEYYAPLNVKYGSIDTKYKVKGNIYKVPNGVAHFLEHINFNEADGKTAHEFFNKLGTSINAYTSFDQTSYEIYGTTNIMENINHLLDYVQTPIITDELVNKERGIIVEEVKMGDNNPGKQMYFGTMRATFHQNRRIYEVTGSADDVKSIKTSDLKMVYKDFYHPANMFLIITGNFNPYEMATVIKENQHHKKYGRFLNPKVIYDKEDISVVKEYCEIKGNVEIPKLNVVYKMSKKQFKNFDDVFIRVYLQIIMNANFGPTSDLKEELMEKELITGLYSSVQIIDDMVGLVISCETRYPHELVNIIKENMNKLSITKDRLIRRIKCNISSLIASFEDIETVNSIINYDILTYKKVLDNVYDIYKELNINDATKIIKKIDLTNCAVVVQIPEKDTK